jgi:hypothetical protein
MWCLAAVVLVLGVGPVEGQILSVYGTFAPVRVSSAPSAPGQNTEFWAPGWGGGVTLNFLPLPVVQLGLDVRGSTKSGTPGVGTALVGLKLGVHPPVLRIKPYIQGSVGYLGIRAPGTTGSDKEFMYEILGGIDYPIFRLVDFRMIEIGGGQAVNTGGGPTPRVFTVNTGIVVHF